MQLERRLGEVTVFVADIVASVFDVAVFVEDMPKDETQSM